MPTLHIEHPIVDFGLWKTAFDRFEKIREQSGVVGHRIQRPVDDVPIWSSPEQSPALVGTPQSGILEPAERAAS